MTAAEVFAQSDGAVTRRYYTELEQVGPIGMIAVCLFRAQKTSTRAKLYRGSKYKSMAYDTKTWSIEQLCAGLDKHGADLGIAFGWGRDEAQTFNRWVLYVDLPEGQVSFHSPARYTGPDYSGEWDGIRGASEERIHAFCDRVSRPAAIPDGRQLGLWAQP